MIREKIPGCLFDTEESGKNSKTVVERGTLIEPKTQLLRNSLPPSVAGLKVFQSPNPAQKGPEKCVKSEFNFFFKLPALTTVCDCNQDMGTAELSLSGYKTLPIFL